MIIEWLDLLFKSLHQERREGMREFPKGFIGTLSHDRYPLIYKY